MSGEQGNSPQGSWLVWLGLFLSLSAGCTTSQQQLDRALLADRGLEARGAATNERYTVFCPDVLEITAETRADLTARHEIGPDGRVDLGSIGRLRIEGMTAAEVARAIAEVAELPPSTVHVRVVEHNSRQLYLVGQVVGLQRAVAYQGPETVLDLLHRVGGLTPGAAPEDVSVVRPHVVDGGRPEVFQVDLAAILLRQDQRTNITLEPQDQVFVGETKRFSLVKCLPPWLQPFYESICGMRRTEEKQQDKEKTAG
jgi:polysaccharide export outer membrane protein